MEQPDGRDRVIKIMLEEAQGNVLVITPAKLARKIELLSKQKPDLIPSEFIKRYNGRSLTVYAYHRLTCTLQAGMPGWEISELDSSNFAIEFRRVKA